MRQRIVFGLTLVGGLMCGDAVNVSAFDILVDYTFDTESLESGAVNGFFNPTYVYADGSTGAQRRERLAQAAATFSKNISDDLLSIIPEQGNHWQLRIRSPGVPQFEFIDDLVVPQDAIIIYAGGRDLGGPILGLADGGRIESWSGSLDFLDTIRHRGEGPAGSFQQASDDFGPWGGTITFTSNIVVNVSGRRTRFDWHFGQTTAELDDTKFDFLTVALHEIGHVLGFGTSGSFSAHRIVGGAPLGSSNMFIGPDANDVYGGEVPLEGTPEDIVVKPRHWQADLLNDLTVMDTTSRVGKRAVMQPLDWAAFSEIGWEVVQIPEPQAIVLSVVALITLVVRDWRCYLSTICGLLRDLFGAHHFKTGESGYCSCSEANCVVSRSN